MKFYTKRSGRHPGDLYNFLWTMRFIFIFLLAGSIQVNANSYSHPNDKYKIQADSVNYKGKITDEKGNPIAGATVKIVETNKITLSTVQGEFFINGPVKGNLEISYIEFI